VIKFNKPHKNKRPREGSKEATHVLRIESWPDIPPNPLKVAAQAWAAKFKEDKAVLKICRLIPAEEN